MRQSSLPWVQEGKVGVTQWTHTTEHTKEAVNNLFLKEMAESTRADIKALEAALDQCMRTKAVHAERVRTCVNH